MDNLIDALSNTKVSQTGVTFTGKSLKLDTAKDAEPVIAALNGCASLQYFSLEGNTLGVEASEAIARALESHPEFKRALWKDMFTGRMKNEIPKSLEYLGNALVTAGARLVELDLSDNAFGPIGVRGLVALLRSVSCHALEELRLNNNGLGITGGKLLAEALLDCYNRSKELGRPLALKVFIAGRNRLENAGATVLAKVFKTIGTLEEIAMPQNGIYHVGISALSEAFITNPNLHTLNLNDNTIGPVGAAALAEALAHLPQMRSINFGDCLLKTKGARCLSVGLQHCDRLEELTLGFNEIRTPGAEALVAALGNKSALRTVVLDGNCFGADGKRKVRSILTQLGKLNALGSLSDDEEPSGDELEENIEEDDGENDEDDDDGEETDVVPSSGEDAEVVVMSAMNAGVQVSALQFVSSPTIENFLALGANRNQMLLSHVQNADLDQTVTLLMKVGALCGCSQRPVAKMAMQCSEELYQHLFKRMSGSECISLLNNTLLVNLGMIKSEDKKFKPSWNIEGCLLSLEGALDRNLVPTPTKDTLRAFMQRDVDQGSDNLSFTKKKLVAKLK